MADESIGPDVAELIEHHIRSVGHLEALTFMYQRRDRAWTPLQLSEELRTNVSYAQRQLRDLTSSGLLKVHKNEPLTYEYASESQKMDRAVESLIDLYKTRRVTVIDAIYARSIETVKGFADAFIIKKE